MPHVKAWFHLVWSTKFRKPHLVKEIRQIVFEHMRSNAFKKGIYIDCINGYTDHIHCLLSLSTNETLSKTIQLIKGESSWWINKEKLCAEKFEWQTEYFAVSVSPSDLQRVRNYIFFSGGTPSGQIISARI